MTVPVLELHRIDKHFGAVQSLSGIDLTLHRGEVLGLVGDNGAGKSVLVKVMSGLLQPDGGQIFRNGQPAFLPNPRASMACGIATVHQDLALCENMTAAENVFLGQEPMKKIGPFSIIDHDLILKKTETYFREIETTARPDALVQTLSGGQRQATAIARAMASEADIVLLDEPTASISLRQAKDLLRFIAGLKEQGKSVIFISHRIRDIFNVCDRVAVLWQGKKIFDAQVGDTTQEDVMSFILGERKGGAA